MSPQSYILLFLSAFWSTSCGTSPLNIQDADDVNFMKRVIGGMEFEEGKWPFLVLLKGKIPDVSFLGITLSYKTYSCGASLINSRWIMTAAHCFGLPVPTEKSLTPKYWKTRLGDIDDDSSLFEKLQGIVGNIFNVDDWKDWNICAEQIIIHPHYDPANHWLHDIALVKLREDVPAGKEILPHIQSVRLPARGDMAFPRDGQRCVMKGWGCTENGGSANSVANEVVLPKVSDEECARFWRIPALTRLCAGYNLESKGICPGDSGGPLSCQATDGGWVQVGIASFTSADRPGNVPGVFTRVSQYMDWIRANTQ